MDEGKDQKDWTVNVNFKSKGVLQASATGLLLVPPEDALALVTHKAGDDLFRVVQRTVLLPSSDGSERVEVINKAAIRVLAWKLWTSNRVLYEVHQPASASKMACTCAAGGGLCSCSSSAEAGTNSRRVTFKLVSSNMLHSLSGSWRLDPVKIHPSSLPAAAAAAAARSRRQGTLISRSSQEALKPCGVQLLAADDSGAVTAVSTTSSRNSCNSCRSSSHKLTYLPVDDDGKIIVTRVTYEQLAQPKGLPPGIRFVPGISDAVRMSIGREVRQMLDKIHYAAMLEVQRGLTPQAALSLMTHQLKEAGGSFKKLTKELDMATSHPPRAAAAVATTTPAIGPDFDDDARSIRLSSSSSMGRRRPGRQRVVSCNDDLQQQVEVGAQLNVQPLSSATAAAAAP